MGRKSTQKKERRGAEPHAPGAAEPAAAPAPPAAEAGPPTKPVVVTDASFDREVLGSDLPVVVDFWAPWCGPCKMIAPVLEEVAASMAGRVKIVKYDTQRNSRVAQALNVRSIPTLVLFREGEVADALIGAVPQARLEAWIEKGIAPKRSLLDRILGRAGEA